MMRKRMNALTITAAMALLLTLPMTAHATEGTEVLTPSGDPFRVTFTQDEKLNSNFEKSDMKEGISGMMPGDVASFSVELDNGDNGETQWYIRNTIITSLEESGRPGGMAEKAGKGGKPGGASDGAYTYRLVYTPPEGASEVLFDSSALGGDGTKGLHEADEALKDYIYLGTMKAGQKGKITLEVGLDGETQGNGYMIRSADLGMNFAVIPEETGAPGSGTHRVVRREVVNNTVVYLDENGDPVPLDDLSAYLRNGGLIKTGDDTALSAWVMAACASGVALMMYWFFAMGRKKKEAEGGGER